MNVRSFETLFQTGAREGPVRDVMRFHLIYSGPLSASGNKSKIDEAAKIRAALSSQIEQLWKKHHALSVLLKEAAIPPQNVGVTISMGPQGLMRPREVALQGGLGFQDLLIAFDVGTRQFLPLVRSSLHLNCEIDILFLRQQDPGALISQGGDIDNRVKTLLDALRMPSGDEEARAPSLGAGLLYCLMESDTLVSRLNIDTDRLLFAESEKPNEVHLVIEISLNVLQVQPYNQCLL